MNLAKCLTIKCLHSDKKTLPFKMKYFQIIMRVFLTIKSLNKLNPNKIFRIVRIFQTILIFKIMKIISLFFLISQISQCQLKIIECITNFKNHQNSKLEVNNPSFNQCINNNFQLKNNSKKELLY